MNKEFIEQAAKVIGKRLKPTLAEYFGEKDKDLFTLGEGTQYEELCYAIQEYADTIAALAIELYRNEMDLPSGVSAARQLEPLKNIKSDPDNTEDLELWIENTLNGW